MDATPEGPGSPLAQLIAQRERFVAFVASRVHDPALADDIVQHAFAKSLDKIDDVRSDESTVAWFYRVLRRTIIDRARASKADTDKLERLARELDARPEDVLADDRNAVCRCVLAAAEGLKAEYAEAIRRVDVDGVAVKDYASEAGVTASNAGVRLFRARQALKAQVVSACGACAKHGCVDCTCRSPTS